MTPRQERNVERTIRLWIAQQERSQRKSRQSGRYKLHVDTPGVRRPRAGTPFTR